MLQFKSKLRFCIFPTFFPKLNSYVTIFQRKSDHFNSCIYNGLFANTCSLNEALVIDDTIQKRASAVPIPKTSASHLCLSTEQVLLSGACQQNKHPTVRRLQATSASEGRLLKNQALLGCICLSKGRAYALQIQNK